MIVGIRLLGGPEAFARGAWWPLEPTRPHAALAYVAVAGGFVRRAELAALLWPEADGARAHTGLRQVLRRLDRGPFGALLGRDRAGLWLVCRSDLADYRRAVSERRWHEALAAHGGPLLAGFALDDAGEFAAWLEGERASVADAWRRACRALLAEAMDAGQHDEALRLADGLVAADPFDESAVRAAMRAALAARDLQGGARRYEALAALLARETGLEPEVETQALWARLAESGASVVGPQLGDPALGLADARTLGERRGVIGREQALADLVEMVGQREARLVTLLGPGGIGKTTLAAALVAELRTILPGAVRIVPLEGVQGPEAVALAVAQALGLPLQRGVATVGQVARALDGRRATLVLDGFELHLDEVGTVDGLLRGASDLRLVVTSRVRLRHSQEVVVEVGPLATRVGMSRPAPEATPRSRPAAPSVSPAAQLFLRAASGRLPLAAVRRLDLDVVERIAASLGGHPLAIELAASWVDVLGLEGLDAQLRVSWAPLQSEDVDRPARRRDVRAVVVEAWEGLAAVDRVAWARLAVMPGSLDPAVAAEVGGSGWRGVRRLLDRAVLRHDGERLALHPLLSRFGREQAVASGISDAAWKAAVPVWRERLARQLDPRTGRRPRFHADDVEQALGAWRWAQATSDWAALADMAVGLQRAMDQRMRWGEASALRREAVGRLLPARGRDRDVALARLLSALGDTLAEVHANAERALALATARSDDLATALAHTSRARGNFTPERTMHVEVARACFERAGDDVGLAGLLAFQGGASVLAGQHALATTFLEDALVRFERLADPDGLALVHAKRGRLALHRGDLATAAAEIRAARMFATRSSKRPPPPFVLEHEAELARVTGDHEQAAAAVEAFVGGSGALVGQGYEEIAMRTVFHLRFGPPDRLLAFASRWAAHRETQGGRIIYRMLANLCVAAAHAQLGSPERAGAPIALAVRLARPLDVPRIVAAIALTAATVAAARGEPAEARRLLARAVQHPSLEYEARLHASALWASLGEDPSIAAGVPPPGGVGPPDGIAPPDDAAILDEVDRWLAGWSAAPDGEPECVEDVGRTTGSVGGRTPRGVGS